MTITKQRKQALIGEFRRAESDSGSPEVQVALLTSRINGLTEHLQSHVKDYACRRSLLMLVSRRRRLLDYLKRVNPQRYLDVIRRLDLRK
jgi:small subunit ribosomal protein S15